MKRLKTSARQIENLAKATEKQVASLVPVLNGMRRVLLAVAKRAKEHSGTERVVVQETADMLLEAVQYLQVDHNKYNDLYWRLEKLGQEDIVTHNDRFGRGIHHEPVVRYLSDAAMWALGMMGDPSEKVKQGSWSIAAMSFNEWQLREFLWNARAAWAFSRNTLSHKDESAYTGEATAAAEKAIHKIFVDGVNEDLARISNPHSDRALGTRGMMVVRNGRRLSTSAYTPASLAKATREQLVPLVPVLNGVMRTLVAIIDMVGDTYGVRRDANREAVSMLLECVHYLTFDIGKYYALSADLWSDAQEDDGNFGKPDAQIRDVTKASAHAIGLLSPAVDDRRKTSVSLVSIEVSESELKEFLRHAMSAWVFSSDLVSERDLARVFVNGVNEDFARAAGTSRGRAT